MEQRSVRAAGSGSARRGRAVRQEPHVGPVEPFPASVEPPRGRRCPYPALHRRQHGPVRPGHARGCLQCRLGLCPRRGLRGYHHRIGSGGVLVQCQVGFFSLFFFFFFFFSFFFFCFSI